MLALKYIHSLNIIHRDLKTSNIFLQENGDLKIGDFGIARVLEGTMHNAESVVGTPYYMSPEICQNKPYSYKSDVWSLGCVLYELCTLEHAFKSSNLLNLVYKIVHEDPDPISSKYSAEVQNLISLLLKKNLSERPTLDQLIQVDFVRLFLVWFMNPDQFEGFDDLKYMSLSEHEFRSHMMESNRLNEKKRLYSDSAHTQHPVDKNRQRISSYDQVNFQQGVMNTYDSFRNSQLTPMEKLKMRKELEAKRREEEMKRAIRCDQKTNPLTEKNPNKFNFGLQNSVYHNTDSGENHDSLLNSKSALKCTGRNVIKNFDTDFGKNSNGYLMNLPKHLNNKSIPTMGDSVASKSNFMNTIKQNLEETIQSQYFPDIKPGFSKSRSNILSSSKLEEPDDFPPDFEDLDE
jgi:NIMA (never in mitosis gene a)-related kinase